jgi:hypothetical protein
MRSLLILFGLPFLIIGLSHLAPLPLPVFVLLILPVLIAVVDSLQP